MKATEIAKFVKKNKTPLLIALGVVVAVVVVWIFARRMRNTGTGNSADTVEKLTGHKVTPGLNFDDLAKRMFIAWISTIGTDENEVYSILKQMNNQADWEYLKQRYEAYWNSLPLYEQVIHTTAGLGLSGVLVSDFRRELSRRELQRCRDILVGKGITPNF